MPEKVEITEARIVEVETVEGKEPLVIIGFVGPGLVGGIAATHIIDQLKMRPISYV
jgi:predicted ATP-grasp superfamily ATP-dependent carboligase